METKWIRINDENREEALALGARLLDEGKVVAMPTETVYGLAVNARNGAAVSEVFRVKGRPGDNPLIVHVCDLIMLKSIIAELPQSAQVLIKKFWPGPLTLVLKKSEEVSDLVTCGLDTVAVRMPSRPLALALIERAGLPLAAPSANLSGRPSPTTGRHVYEDLRNAIPLILDDGPCEVGVESTVLSLAGETPLLLRPGIVSLEQIRELLPDAQLAPGVMEPDLGDRPARSPGMKYRHYAPRAELTIVRGSLKRFIEYTAQRASADTYAMCFDGEEEHIGIPSVAYGPADRPEIQARRLFAVLRALDGFGARAVFVRAPAESGVAMAVYNRLVRAAGNRVVEL